MNPSPRVHTAPLARLASGLAAFVAVATGSAAAQSVSVFEQTGGPGEVGRVRVLHASKAQPPQSPTALQGIRLLPIDCTGRTPILRLMPDRAQRLDDVAGAGRLRLPERHGSLYRFARAEPGGGTTFGFFLVEPDGRARPVLERAGTGLAGDQDPFVARIAVGPRGDAFLAATRPAAGGDLLQVELADGRVTLRTPGATAYDFSDAGLALHTSWGVAVHSSGVWRFDRGDRAPAEPVPFPAPNPSHFSGQLVLSSNGAFAATTAGVGPALLHAWVLGPQGAAVRASSTPEPMAGAGFLPEAPDGPHLAVSDDGTRCAWRRDGVTQEAFMATVVAPGAGTPAQLHVTSDTNYLDTLDAVGQFIFIGARLMLSVGERDLQNGIHRLDVYAIDLGAGGPSFTNVSLSSGDPDVPFLAPSTIDPDGSSVWVPQAGEFLLADSDRDELIAVRLGQTGVRVLATDVKELTWVERAGDRLALALRRESGNKPRQIATLPPDLSAGPTILFTEPNADELARPAVRPGAVAWVENHPTFERVRRADLATGAVELLTQRPFFYGTAAAFTATGELALSVGAAPAPAIFLAWPQGGLPLRLASPGVAGFVLPAE